MLGQLLTFYRIRWVYEPTNFVLKRTAAGAVAESFTPDFYLPDHGVYLELTTMRQPLVTRKNGKIRRLRELYPSVQIKTLYRRDYDRILQTSGPGQGAATDEIPAVVFDFDQIAARTKEIAKEIFSALAEAGLTADPLVLTAIKAEAEPFQTLLAAELAALGVRVETDGIELSRFKIDSIQRRVSLLRRPRISHEGRVVLLVAGATSTGLSLEYALRRLRGQHPRWLEAVSLLDRDSARVVDTEVRFRGFDAPPELLTGFGLTIDDDGAIVRPAAGVRLPVAVIEV
jgi:hypoxanthine-guanine phosphoribosyltransferase